MDPYQEPLVLPLSPLHTLWWIGSQSSNPLTPAPWTKDNWSSASASHWLKTNSRFMEKEGERKVFVWSIEVCRRCWYWISWSSIRMPLLCIYPHGPLMGFIRIGANQYEWVDSGGVGGGFSISKQWSHLLSAAQEEAFSFIKSVHSLKLVLRSEHTNTCTCFISDLSP